MALIDYTVLALVGAAVLAIALRHRKARRDGHTACCGDCSRCGGCKHT